MVDRLLFGSCAVWLERLIGLISDMRQSCLIGSGLMSIECSVARLKHGVMCLAIYICSV